MAGERAGRVKEEESADWGLAGMERAGRGLGAAERAGWGSGAVEKRKMTLRHGSKGVTHRVAEKHGQVT